jgi:hypothetical protein
MTEQRQAQQRERKPTSMPESWREWFPKDHIMPYNLFVGGKYIAPKVRIERIVMKGIQQTQEQGGGKKDKPVAYFKGKAKYLILNTTMCEVLEKISGSQRPLDWVGLTVELFVTTARKPPKKRGEKAEQVDVVRIRAVGGGEPQHIEEHAPEFEESEFSEEDEQMHDGPDESEAGGGFSEADAAVEVQAAPAEQGRESDGVREAAADALPLE